MAQILAFPFELRLLILFVGGCALGAVCNWAIYSLAYHPRPISPWSRPPADAPPRRCSDRIPVFGWFGLARETKLHGRGFWVRPLIVEVMTGVLLAGLYWWETDELGLLTAQLQQDYRFELAFRAVADPLLHANYLAHAILLLFMLVASLIDLDEMTIPDLVTIPGTLIGLSLLAIVPLARLPEIDVAAPGGAVTWIASVQLASPLNFPATLGGAPSAAGLAIGLACYLFWCFALLPRSWRTRHGWGRAMRIFVARIAREPFTWIVAAVALAGVCGIVAVWSLGGEQHWESLLSSLVGLAAGGGIVWSVRIIGRFALRKEAMGFGDVTLMAMIGSFLGWQACLFVFFLAPFAGLLLGVANWMAHREHELPYGPFLCLAALFVIVQWAGIWEWASPFFSIPWLVPGAMAACMAIMLVLLTGLRWLRGS